MHDEFLHIPIDKTKAGARDRRDCQLMIEGCDVVVLLRRHECPWPAHWPPQKPQTHYTRPLYAAIAAHLLFHETNEYL